MITLQRLAPLLAALCSPAYASPAPLQKNMSFFGARERLLKARWKPINVHQHDDYARMGVEHELAKMKFNEFDSCSIDVSNCIMRYRRGNECLTVFTIGEKIKYMKVVDWSDECPALPPPVAPAAEK